MKRLLFLSGVVLIVILLVLSCAKKEVIPGLVGEPIHLAAMIESPSDTVGCTFKWSFISKPENSNLDVLSFQPTSRNFNIYFIPDVPGEYVVQNIIYDPSGREKKKNIFTCQVSLDTTSVTAPEETTMVERQLRTAPEKPEEKALEKAPPAKIVYEEKTLPTEKEKKLTKAIPKVPGKYTIQLSSWRTYKGAEKALKLVKKKGIDAYIQKVYIPELKGTWYRVRTGAFSTYREAKEALLQLKKILRSKDLWIDYMRKDQ